MRREDKGKRRETGGYQDRWQETEPSSYSRSYKESVAKRNKSKSAAKERQRKESSERRETASTHGGGHVGSHLS